MATSEPHDSHAAQREMQENLKGHAASRVEALGGSRSAEPCTFCTT